MRIITNVQKYEFGDSYEVRCYERGLWQHDKYVENIEEGIERMNFLIRNYDFKEDDVQLIRISHFENITENQQF